MRQDFLENSAFFLGIPLDVLSSEEFLEKLKTDDKKMVTINVITPSLLDKLYHWFFWKNTNPELLINLRKSDYTFLDPVLSKSWYGKSFDWDTLFKNWADSGKKVVLAGRDEEALTFFKDNYLRKNPTLETQIVISSLTHEGEGLEKINLEEAEFAKVLEEIKPDILLLNLPASEIPSLLERLRAFVRIPVIMQLNWKGEKLSFLSKMKIHYLKMVTALLTYFDEKERQLFREKVNEAKQPFLFKFGHEKPQLLVVSFSPLFSKDEILEMMKDNDYQSHDIQIYDFTLVKFLDLNGLNFLMHVLKVRLKKNQETFFVNIPWHIKRMMRLHRVYDYFSPFIFANREKLIKNLELQGVPFFWSITNNSKETLISFFGQLDVRQDRTFAFEQITSKLLRPKIIFNFDWCYHIDSSGLGFLLRLRKVITQLRKSLVLYGLNTYIKQTFKITKVDKLFNIQTDLKSALDYVEK